MVFPLNPDKRVYCTSDVASSDVSVEAEVPMKYTGLGIFPRAAMDIFNKGIC